MPCAIISATEIMTSPFFEIGPRFSFKAIPDLKKNVASPSRSPVSVVRFFWSGGERDAKFDIHDLKGRSSKNSSTISAMRQREFHSAAIKARPLFLESASNKPGQVSNSLNWANSCRCSPNNMILRDPRAAGRIESGRAAGPPETPANHSNHCPHNPRSGVMWRCSFPEATTHEAVLQIVKQAKPANLESVELVRTSSAARMCPKAKRASRTLLSIEARTEALTDGRGQCGTREAGRNLQGAP